MAGELSVVDYVGLFRAEIPARVPDLKRFTQRAEFRDLHSAAAEWMDSHFQLIEREAPWLSRTERTVTDYCITAKNFRRSIGEGIKLFFQAAPRVTCQRRVVIAYGFAGSLPSRLADLTGALARVGWSAVDVTSVNRPAGRASSVRWESVPGSAAPPLLQAKPADRALQPCAIGIAWSSQGQGQEQEIRRYPHVNASDIRFATPLYQPVELTGDPGLDSAPLANTALAANEHAVGIVMTLDYYVNSNTNARPHRLRKRLLPVR